MNPEIIVPVSFFIMVLLIVKFYLTHQRNKRLAWHETFRHALQQDATLDPQAMQKLATSMDPQRHDLRKGLIFLSIAIALLVFGFVAPFQDSQGNRVVMSLSILPCIFGLTYLGFWRFWYRY